MNRVAVLGAGAWGRALAIQAARAGCQVTLWARDLARARAHPRLPGFPLPPAITLTDARPTNPCDAVLLAVPMAHLASVLTGWHPGGPVAVCAKGLDPASLRLPGEILRAHCPEASLAVLSGPNFAAEIAAGLPAAAVLASEDPVLRAYLMALLSSPEFRLYGQADVLGTQICGAMKNVIAIAAGAVIGAGLGENARAALVTRGIAEMARLVAALGGQATTAHGLAGLGDLLLTCTGPSSRNFSLGHALGAGRGLADVLAERDGATEGVATAPALLARAPGLELPICASVASLLAEEVSVSEAMRGLVARPLRDEG